jgi:RNA recognition motif-containing protein
MYKHIFRNFPILKSMYTKLFVGNLPTTITKRDLLRFFAPYGDIELIDIILCEFTQLPRGFAYIIFSSFDSAKAALSAHGRIYMERKLIVNLAIDDDKLNPTTH